MKYIIYARKSTESEYRQVMYLESQFSELKEFAAKEKFVMPKADPPIKADSFVLTILKF